MSELKIHVSEESAGLESSSDSEKELMCASCIAVGDHRQAVKFCIDCVQLVCQNCVDIHLRFKQMKEHKFVDIGQEEDLKFSQMLSKLLVCPNHEQSDMTVKFVCKKHNVLCCFTCAAVSHRSCPDVVEIAKEAVDKKQSVMVDELKNHLNAADEQLMIIIKENDNSKVEFIASADIHIPKKLQELKVNINYILAELEQNILEECVKKKMLYVAQRDDEVRSLKEERESVKEALNFLASVQKNGSDTHLYIAMDQLQKKQNTIDAAIAKQGKAFRTENISFDEGPALRQILSGNPCSLATLCVSKSDIPLPEYKFTQKEDINVKETSAKETSKSGMQIKGRRRRSRAKRGGQSGWNSYGYGYGRGNDRLDACLGNGGFGGYADGGFGEYDDDEYGVFGGYDDGVFGEYDDEGNGGLVDFE